MRFWFRFVFPFQEELKTGLPPEHLYDAEIAPALGEHTSPTFESLCRLWTLRTGRATRLGSWWGNALNEQRRAGARLTEEIDVVGVERGRVTIVGECKWTTAPLGPEVLKALETFKLPAIRQAGVRIASGGPRIVLFARSGFKETLTAIVSDREDVTLVSADELVGDLGAS